jgi:hypothetical protein
MSKRGSFDCEMRRVEGRKSGRRVMIYRDSRNGLRTFHLIAIMSFLAANGFPNGAGAQPSATTTASTTANKTLNVFCRAADQPHAALPAQRSSVEQALSPTDAKDALDVIQKLSNTQGPLCSQDGAAPDSALIAIDKLARRRNPGVGPINNPDDPPLAANVPPEVLDRTSIKVRSVYDGVKANE